MPVSRPEHNILLRNGTVLIHEGTLVQPLQGHDILIEGYTIKKIGQGLELPTGGKEIDCTRKIISPGFVDTHHHLWQTQLKGRHCDHTLMQYYPTGNMQPFNYKPEDIFWGQLAGCLQSIDAGVTTVVDHAHILVANDIFVSATPETELQMGHGHPVAFHPILRTHTSLGIDCHSNNSADMLTQMRLALQHSRAAHNLATLRAGEPPRVDITVEEAFNLGTIRGAAAVNMADQIGSLAEGKKADIVVFDATSPGMVCAAEENPVGAILLHAGVRDVEMVIVDGQVRKGGGKLLPVEILETVDAEKGVEIGWAEVAQHVLESRERIIQKAKGQDVRAAKMW